MNKFIFNLSKIIATFFGVGYSRFAPGTMGSIATIPLWMLINHFLSKWKVPSDNYILILLLIIAFIYIIGYYTTAVYIKEVKKEDPSEVVIDEVVGQMIAFTITLFTFFLFQNSNSEIFKTIYIIIPLIIFPFILFRIFDIKKPNLIGYIDSNIKNANGVMLDDVIAGIYAGLVNIIFFYIMIKIYIFKF